MKNLYNEFEKNKEFESLLAKNKEDIHHYKLLEYIIELENTKIDWDTIAKKCDEEAKKYDAPRIFHRDVLDGVLRNSDIANEDRKIDWKEAAERAKKKRAKYETFQTHDQRILEAPMRY